MASVRKRAWTHKGEAKEAWVVSYTDAGGKRRLKTFDKKKEADRYRTKVEAEIAGGTHVPDAESLTVAALAKEYVAELVVRNREGRRMGKGNLSNKIGTIENYILPSMGRLLVKDVRSETVEVLARHLGERRVKRCIDIGKFQKARGHVTGTRTYKPVGMLPKSINAHLSVLKLLIDFAVRRGYVGRNVVETVLRERRGARPEIIRLFTLDQVQALLTYTSQRPYHISERGSRQMQLYVHLATFCGLRLGEINGLTVASLNFDGGMIHVRHSLTVYGEHKPPKSDAGNRDVPMPEHLAEMARAWIADHYKPDERRMMFVSAGHRAGFGGFRHAWHRLLDRLGLARDEKRGWYHFHALRHFYTSQLVSGGLPVTEVAKLLGHSSAAITLSVYAHANEQHDLRIAAVSRLVGGVLALPPCDKAATRPLRPLISNPHQ